MIKVTAAHPDKRLANIMTGMTTLHGDNDKNLLSAWGVEAGTKLVEVTARVLQPPVLSFANGKTLRVSGGSWRIDEGNHFTQASTLGAWSFAVFGSQDNCRLPQVEKFVKMLDSMLSEKGVKLYFPAVLSKLVVYMVMSRGLIWQGHKLDIEGTLKNARQVALQYGAIAKANGIPRKNKREIDLVLCVMMGRNNVYPDIKRYAETTMGVMTQCMLAKVRGY